MLPLSAALLATALLLLAAPSISVRNSFNAIRKTSHKTVRCPSDCTMVLQQALSDSNGHIILQPPLHGAATVGGPDVSTRLLADGTDMTVELAPGLVLVGFLNTTFAPSTGSDPARGYSPALVTLEINAVRFTLLGHDSVLQHITGSVGGTDVRIESVRFVDPGWDGLYARGAVGLTLKGCVFDRPYRNGISVIDAVDLLAEDCEFSNSLPNGTGRVSPMAGVDLEPNRPTDRLANITFRRCRSVNNSGAGFQVFPGALNGSSVPIDVTFEDCHVSGVGSKPYSPIVACGYYFNAFNGHGAPGRITVTGGSVAGTNSFGAAVYTHGANDAAVGFDGVLFDHVAVDPAPIDPKLHFTNGPIIIAGLGSAVGGHPLGGVTFHNVVVKDGMARPVLVVDGTGSVGLADIHGTIKVETPHGRAGCSVVAGGWSPTVSRAAEKALASNITVTCAAPSAK